MRIFLLPIVDILEVKTTASLQADSSLIGTPMRKLEPAYSFETFS